jgi:crossover junction endodeoxyribonuclease RusA
VTAPLRPYAPLRTLSFPAPADMITLNDRLHRMKEAALIVAWREAVGWQALAKFRRTHHLPPSIVDVALPVKGKRRRDPHNWTPTAKAALDGLVDAGWWPDDNSDWVTLLEPTLVLNGDVVTVTVWAR